MALATLLKSMAWNGSSVLLPRLVYSLFLWDDKILQTQDRERSARILERAISTFYRIETIWDSINFRNQVKSITCNFISPRSTFYTKKNLKWLKINGHRTARRGKKFHTPWKMYVWKFNFVRKVFSMHFLQILIDIFHNWFSMNCLYFLDSYFICYT